MNEFEYITPAQALDHPNWEMGKNNHRFRNNDEQRTGSHRSTLVVQNSVQNIEIVIHRESIIHSMVEFIDGSFLAQMGLPDMRVPLAIARDGR
ncbi:MAG: hypothetical protein CM1200mP30_27060 [Pseudomonadota bacterium]|nr:MAG: hypothetical protein CM1200mP30_27060 [Pseudomonadota bacterium]